MPYSVSGVELAVAAQAARDQNATPAGVQAAIKAAGFGPHDKWPTEVARSAITALTASDLATATQRNEFAKEHAAFAAGDANARADLANWLVQLGDPAWQAVDNTKAKTFAEALVAARGQLAQAVVANVTTAVFDAAVRAKTHDKASLDTYKTEDADRKKRHTDDSTPADVVAEEDRRVAEFRTRQRTKAMWEL